MKEFMYDLNQVSDDRRTKGGDSLIPCTSQSLSRETHSSRRVHVRRNPTEGRRTWDVCNVSPFLVTRV